MLILLMGLYFTSSQGQETFGAVHSNYQPSNSVLINPSSMLDAKTWLDIDLLDVGAYVNNDFVYAQKSSMISLLSGGGPRQEDILYNQGRNKYHFYNRTFVNTLVGVWNTGDHAIGIHIGGRVYADVRRLDNVMSQFIENGITQYTPQHLTDYTTRRFRVNVLGYGQAQLSYAYTFKKKGKVMMMGGLSLKKIFPLGGAAISVNEINYNVQNAVQLNIHNLTGDMMGSFNPEFSLKGGMGLDLGFTYQKMYKNCRHYHPHSRRGGCEPIFYKWKLGISILDLGYAKFNPRNINYVGYDFEDYEFFNYADVDVDQNNFQNVLIDAESTPDEGLIRKPHKMSLPTALSVQFDYNVLPHYLYLNLSWMQGVPPTRRVFGPRRASWIAFTPRIETRFLDVALPFSLYEYRYPQIGFSLRLYFLTIGTDKLGSWLFKSNLYGTDIYAQLKIPLFRSPKCMGRDGGGRKRKPKRGKWGKEWPHCDAYN